MNIKEREAIEKMMVDHPLLPANYSFEIVKDMVFVLVLAFIPFILCLGAGYFFDFFSLADIQLVLTSSLAVFIVQSVINAIGSIKKWRAIEQWYLDEINSGLVNESHHLIVAVKVGKLTLCEEVVYFLLFDDGLVFVLYGGDPTDPAAVTDTMLRREFRMVRSINNDLFVDCQFSGSIVAIEGYFTMPDNLDECPEDEAFCDVPWDEIEQRYKVL